MSQHQQDPYHSCMVEGSEARTHKRHRARSSGHPLDPFVRGKPFLFVLLLAVRILCVLALDWQSGGEVPPHANGGLQPFLCWFCPGPAGKLCFLTPVETLIETIHRSLDTHKCHQTRHEPYEIEAVVKIPCRNPCCNPWQTLPGLPMLNVAGATL